MALLKARIWLRLTTVSLLDRKPPHVSNHIQILLPGPDSVAGHPPMPGDGFRPQLHVDAGGAVRSGWWIWAWRPKPVPQLF
jgi:hypothetical protein